MVLPNKPSHAYYDERFTKDNHVKAYEQRKTVRDKPNPPPGEWSANNDRHATGYADYQPGYIYISADCIGVKNVPNRPLRPRPPASSVLKAKAKVKPRPTRPQIHPTKATKVQKVSLKVKAVKAMKPRWSQVTASKQETNKIYKQQRLPKASRKWTSKEDENKYLLSLNLANPTRVQKKRATRAAKRGCSSADNHGPKGFWVWVE